MSAGVERSQARDELGGGLEAGLNRSTISLLTSADLQMSRLLATAGRMTQTIATA